MSSPASQPGSTTPPLLRAEIRGAIRRIVNVAGTLTDGARGDGPLDGPVELWIDNAHADGPSIYGSTPSLSGRPTPGTTMIERLAAEVIPAVREATREQV